jgi:hypothetical protein
VRRLFVVTLLGCSAAPKSEPLEAPVVVRPTPECPPAIVTEPPKEIPPAAPAASAPVAEPKIIAEPKITAPAVSASSPLALAISRIPPQRWRVKLVEVQALPNVAGSLRVQGRGSVTISTHNPMYANVANAQLEVGLPNVDASCRDILTRARDAKSPVELEGLATAQATHVHLLGQFALVEFKSVTVCTP